MKNINQIIRVLAAVLIGITAISSLAYAQQTNPNKLRPCPTPDYSKKTDSERFAKWTKCWGRYQIELHQDFKGDVLEGEWLNGWLHGQGTFTSAKGNKYVGEFKDGNRNGRGTYTFANGDKYVGEYKDGKMNGQGTYTFNNGNKYVGEYQDGKYNGQRTFTFAQGHGYTGQWLDGKPHGKGKETYADGRQPNEGVFESGKFVRAEKLNLPNPNIATNTDRTDIDRERQQLAEERRLLEEEERQQ